MNTNFLTFLFMALPLLFHTANAADSNITKILGENSKFSTFNQYLTEFGLVGDINSRKTITVLAVDNPAMELLSKKPKEVIKKIMSVHVLLDYYDLSKLKNSTNSTTITTLFQASGQALAEQGFLKATGATFTSGPSGGNSNAKATAMDEVFTKQYDLSIVHISNVIVPPGIESTPNASPPNHANAPASSPPAGQAPKSAPAPSQAKAPSSPNHPSGPAAAPGGDTAPTPSSPKADVPSAATTPAASEPDDSDSPESAEGPDAKSYAVRAGINTLLATKLVILACWWMI